LLKAIVIILIEAYVAIPSPINIVQNILKQLFQILPLCPGTFCSAETLLLLIPTILGVFGIIESCTNDLKSLSFIKEQIKNGKFL
jgi:hypothetical protein